MNHLISIRSNFLYSKSKKESGEDEYKKYYELIFLVDKPSYLMTNEREPVRQRGIEELRFTVSEDAFKQMIEILTGIKDAKDEPDQG